MQGSRLPTRNQWVKNLNLRFIEDGHSYLFRKSWKYCFLFSIMNPKFSFSVPLTGNSTLSLNFPYIFCINSQAPDVPELAHQGIFHFSRLSVNCYVKTVKKYSLYLNRADFMRALSVPQDHCGTHNNFMNFFQKIILFMVFTYFQILAFFSLVLRLMT